MKKFATKQVFDAIAYAEAGGQALHLMSMKFIGGKKVPACFARSETFAHLLDYDHDRLVATARRLGVRVIKVDRAGGHGQHVDLCGRPLERAIREAEDTEGATR